MHTTIYTPYTYIIGWTELDMWYYGVRTAKQISSYCLYESGCHPDELWVTYFTSSKYVTNFRQKYGEPDIILVDKTFPNNPLKAREYEHEYLLNLKVHSNNKWLNISNGGKNFFLVNHSDDTKIKMSKQKTGKNHPFYGKKHSDETITKMKNSKRNGVQTGNKPKKVSIDNIEYESIRHAARILNINHQNILYRIKSKSPKFNNYYVII